MLILFLELTSLLFKLLQFLFQGIFTFVCTDFWSVDFILAFTAYQFNSCAVIHPVCFQLFQRIFSCLKLVAAWEITREKDTARAQMFLSIFVGVCTTTLVFTFKLLGIKILHRDFVDSCSKSKSIATDWASFVNPSVRCDTTLAVKRTTVQTLFGIFDYVVANFTIKVVAVILIRYIIQFISWIKLLDVIHMVQETISELFQIFGLWCERHLCCLNHLNSDFYLYNSY